MAFSRKGGVGFQNCAEKGCKCHTEPNRGIYWVIYKGYTPKPIDLAPKSLSSKQTKKHSNIVYSVSSDMSDALTNKTYGDIWITTLEEIDKASKMVFETLGFFREQRVHLAPRLELLTEFRKHPKEQEKYYE